MYQALYRKYRPQTFDDVVEQKQCVTAIVILTEKPCPHQCVSLVTIVVNYGLKSLSGYG